MKLKEQQRKVKIIVPWQSYSKGAILEPPATLRGWLIDNGYAVPIDNETVESKLSKRGKKKKQTRAAA